MKGLQKRILAGFAALLLAGTLSACSADSPEQYADLGRSPASEDDSGWTVADSGTVELQNGHVRFVLDAETTHFTVTDTAAQKTYRSVPEQAVASASEEQNARAVSELTVKYYDSQSKEYYMHSDADSVQRGAFTVRTKDQRVRVAYAFGSVGDERVVPQLFTKEMFENVVLEKLDGSSKIRRIKRYYSLYSAEEPDDEYKAMAEKYPALEKQDLYILGDSFGDMQFDEIAGYMEEIGYTAEDYEAELATLGVTQDAAEEKPGFSVTVEYALTEDGFSARILADRLAEASSAYVLQQIDFLEYFSAFDETAKGEYFVPDGSGALIGINSSRQESYQQSLYGDDLAVRTTKKTQLSKTAALPVFGILEDRTAVLGIVEGAAAEATLKVRTLSASSPRNVAYTSFSVRSMDVTNAGELRNIPKFNLYGKHQLKENPALRFVLLHGEKAQTYADLANAYRGYLLQTGVLTERLTAEQDVPLYIDYLCALSDPSQFLGVPYDRRVVLSDLSSIMDVQSALREKGIGNTVIRLNGYTKDGIAHGRLSTLSLYGGVGSTDELKTLVEQQNAAGGSVFFDADFQFVYRDRLGDGFDQKRDSAQYLNRSLIHTGDYDRVTRDYTALPYRFYTSPAVWLDTARAFADDLGKTLGGGKAGLSYSSAGAVLGGDHSAKRDMDRSMAEEMVRQTLAEMSGRYPLMTDNGNAYTLSYVGHLLNLPLTSSAMSAETKSVPFFPMVIHGYIRYAGSPLDLAADSEESFLRSVECGASLYFTWITGENSLFGGTDYAVKYYSLHSGDSFDTAVGRYTQAKAAMNAVQDAVMIGHEEWLPEVFCTRYDNGVSILVNYRAEAVETDGVTVGAKSFCILGADQ